ncbi:PREDICTED: SCP2 sterol-binding domain-containing protein 1 [Thamnophis sirtalis]|uniref:SCP2 sterol-binding domain-containing protein 1 n=1 Tax=Thamnophis sirtalis TaxID=35019 RepID=A0A6I9YGU4_9SAUR|nr:PREDICTED: SCP2 sterol-binding domain-containing protein 1 [Thamnophis sirtalis]
MWKERLKCLQMKINTSEQTAVSDLYEPLMTSRNASTKGPGLQSDLIFEQIGHRIKGVGSQLVKKVNAVFQWDIMNGGKVVAQWTLDLKSGSGQVYPGASHEPANTVFILSEHDFMELALGKIKPQKAFLFGKVKVKGNILLGQKLEMILKEYAKI